MKFQTNSCQSAVVALLLLLPALAAPSGASASTAFVLTDETTTLFCNNEDGAKSQTRIWFKPGKGTRGCVYVGFEDGWAQGGLNRRGLAFDWVGGCQESWNAPPGSRKVRGNPAQRMLESCATVEEAIRFFERNFEPAFTSAKLLVADPSGSSAVIGARQGRLEVVKARTSGGLGHHAERVRERLLQDDSASVENAASVLKASQQTGPLATQYSNIFDLKTGRIWIYQFLHADSAAVLDLEKELKKGAHYYDLPQIAAQSEGKGHKLTREMKR
jgi:hypothetical protein